MKLIQRVGKIWENAITAWWFWLVLQLLLISSMTARWLMTAPLDRRTASNATFIFGMFWNFVAIVPWLLLPIGVRTKLPGNEDIYVLISYAAFLAVVIYVVKKKSYYNLVGTLLFFVLLLLCAGTVYALEHFFE